MTKIKSRNKQMNDSLSIIIILLSIAGLSWLSYTIVDKQKQIEQLQEQLQHEQFKYKMLYRDPMVKKAIESGG
nr:MAG TPA: cell division protein [Caudoviricetes sp.]